MSRRRPSFRAYLRRRWRAVGLVLVLLTGALLVLVVTDRGHDPLWQARGGWFDEVAPAPDGSVVYTLKRDDGTLTSLEARSGATGGLLWGSPLDAQRALLRAGNEGVAVATDFPLAFLTLYASDGSIRYQIALEGNPRAMALEDGIVALALQSPSGGNPVLIIEDGAVVATHRFPNFVNALDLRGGWLAVGTAGGDVVAFAPDGAEWVNASLAHSVRSVRLAADGGGLVVGGFSLMPGDLSGMVGFFDLTPTGGARWVRSTQQGVALVDVDADGTRVLALEESPPRHTLRVYEAGSGKAEWGRVADGPIARDDAGAFGGAAMGPDGSTVVAATLRGGIQGYRADDGSSQWGFAAEGSTVVAFARDTGKLVVTNGRLATAGPYDALFLFSSEDEPPTGQIALVALVLVLVGAAVTTAGLAWGYWRLRRTY